MKKINRIAILLSCILCLVFMFACTKQKEDGEKNYITFRNSNPGSWEGEKSEASTKIGIMDEDGSNLRYLDLENMGIEGQNTWAPRGVVKVEGKKKLVLSSSEGGMVQLASTVRNVWTYDFETEEVIQILDYEGKPNTVEFIRQMNDGRILIVEKYEDGINKYYYSDLDGNNKEEVILDIPGGYTYYPNITPDGKYFIVQLASPYSIYRCNIDGSGGTVLASSSSSYCFGGAVSPDSKWVAFNYFNHNDDPLHEWANVYVVNIETLDRKKIIGDKSYWLTGYHGDENVRGGGSNGLYFAPFGEYVTIVKGLEDSKSPWKVDPEDNPDNHFNCVYDESIAKGGTGITLVDIFTGEEIEITKAIEGNWDFRPMWNQVTHKLLFIRAKTGGTPELWMCDKDGSNQKLITKGYNDVGADHPGWIN